MYLNGEAAGHPILKPGRSGDPIAAKPVHDHGGCAPGERREGGPLRSSLART